MIGIYDSGIGGLGIFNTIKQVLPQESILYYGDTRYFPFGERSAEDVKAITLAGMKKLAERCHVIVIACNTASVNNLDYYRTQVSVPIIGVVPVIKTAAQLTKNGHIALLATPGTVMAPYTDQLIADFAPHSVVHKIPCAGLANAIEHGEATLEQLKPFIQDVGMADIIVLGCTHYTLAKGKIQHLVGPDVKVIDSNEAVARQTLRVLQRFNLFHPQAQPQYLFDCSGNQAEFLEQVKRHAHI